VYVGHCRDSHDITVDGSGGNQPMVSFHVIKIDEIKNAKICCSAKRHKMINSA
jgi:hypothetical protein